MFERWFMPLETHADDGLWITGEAFKDAAAKLVEVAEGSLRSPHTHLPINYLYRHAIELFLKSAIVIVHRALKLPTGDDMHSPDPLIRFGSKWRRLDRTHSVKNLTEELKRLLTENKASIATLTPNNWDVPSEFEQWISTIDASDEGSTYFRYPKDRSPTEDAKKSSFVHVRPEEVSARLQSKTQPPGIFLAMKDESDRIVAVYGLQDQPLSELREALQKASDMMSGAAFGLYAELIDGAGKMTEDIRAKVATEIAAAETERAGESQ